jgi:phenylacetic acid degradation protein
MPCYSIDGVRPVVDSAAYVHPTAVLIGDVIVGPGCYVGPLVSLRGDFGRIVLETDSNVQDTCVMHGFPGTDTVVEERGHVGHGAVLHGCRVKVDALVGMNAVIMDSAVIGISSFVAAMAFVKAGFQVPDRHLVAGTPARIIRELGDDEIAWKGEGTRDYIELAKRSTRSMVETTPLEAVEPDRRRVPVGGSVPLFQARR